MSAGERPLTVQARRIRPEAGPLDRRRLAAAGLSALLPGLGQLFNRRTKLALLFLIPAIVLMVVALLLLLTQSPARLFAWAVAPAVMSTLLALNGLLLAWRLFAVGQAFLDTRWSGPTSRVGIIGIIALMAIVALPHVLLHSYGTAAARSFDRIFTGGTLGSTSQNNQVAAPLNTRVNVLLLGIDKLPWRPATLTDTMMVASLDPVGKTVSLVSIPRDLIGVPLGNGDVYGPKLNSLMSYVDRNPKDFEHGGIRTLEDAIGALLGIKIDYYAKMEFRGFIHMIDAVGGVDIDVKDGFDDPTYDGYGFDGRGYSITVGPHHLDGVNALAYARSRKALGETDFARASRQQEILVALRDAVTKDGTLLFKLPELLDAVGETIKTDVPVDRLPQLAAIADEVGKDGVIRAVIGHPLVRSKETRYGSSLIPDLEAIREVADKLFPTPGQQPLPWPTPKPTKPPKSAAPSATP